MTDVDLKNEPLHRRFVFALKGLREAYRTERSMRTHVAGLAFVLAILVYVRPEPIWWAALLAAAAFVLATEMLNSALEALADRVSPDIDPLICKAKDCAAGAVLIASITAIAVAVTFVVHIARTR